MYMNIINGISKAMKYCNNQITHTRIIYVHTVQYIIAAMLNRLLQLSKLPSTENIYIYALRHL